jgi:hypothetical protein
VSKQSKVGAKLRRALGKPSIYRVSRRSESMDRVEGFVVGLGKKWVLLARTADGGYPDGLTAIRVRDVSSIEKDRSFATEFANTQSQPSPAELTSIDLDRTDQVIETMSALAGMVAVERERIRTGSMWIGEYQGKRGKWFGLLEVRPNASWHRKPFAYRLRDVTTVSVQSRYLRALAAIAQESPALAVQFRAER